MANISLKMKNGIILKQQNIAKLTWLNLINPVFSHHLTLLGGPEVFTQLAASLDIGVFVCWIRFS